jgi:diguanylate cyclase
MHGSDQVFTEAGSAPDFREAAARVLKFLHGHLGFDLWMITRTEGEDWIVLQVEDSSYGVNQGQVFRWTDSFCSRMVQGLGPRIAPDSASVPVYTEAPIGQKVQIGSYAGVPLTYRDGSLFGTLCAIDPRRQPDSITRELPLIELLADMLSSLLHNELAATEATRAAERAQIEAETDVITGLFNRRGWNRVLEAEETRCKTLGNPACVIAVDLDGLKQINDRRGHSAGDELIQRAAKVIGDATRKHDAVARIGGDEFTILGLDCDAESSSRLAKRISSQLTGAGVTASVGFTMRNPAKGLDAAWKDADIEMYRDKTEHRRLAKAAGCVRPGCPSASCGSACVQTQRNARPHAETETALIFHI